MPRLHRQLLTALVGEIVRGRPEPGAMLPREADLAADFQVSRGVVRESLRGLEERGLVEVRHGRGAEVRARGHWDVLDADVLSAVLVTDGPAVVAREFAEFRAVVEVAVASLAAVRAVPDDVAALRSSLRRMARYGGRAAGGAYQEAEMDFHERLGAAGGNRMLARAARAGRRAVLDVIRPASRPPLEAYAALLDAVERRSPTDAEQAMRDVLAVTGGPAGDLEIR